MDIPINVDVECSEGNCGKSTVIIVDPRTDEVTHVVVKEKQFPNVEHLVLVNLIESTTPNLIKLSCSKQELSKMDEFIEHKFIRTEKPYDRYTDNRFMLWPYYYPIESQYVDLQKERIPPGELAIHRGAQVMAVDGRVGSVDEFLTDPQSGHITHLILREGHLWGKRDVTIPVSQLDHISNDTVYLKLDKSSVEALPDVPVKRVR